MKTNARLNVPQGCAVKRLRRVAALAGMVIFAAAASLRAEVPSQGTGRIGGIYKVVSSTDPLFPATRSWEIFLDFGRGVQGDKTSGSVAVSFRQNPHVRVRIMAWQFFPEQGLLVMGNPYAEGSRNAVVKGAWRVTGTSGGVIFERGNYQIVLHRADPADY